MVLQGVLSYILNKYLGTFVENLDANQLNVGIWGGDVELKGLVLKHSALDELDLPVQIVYGLIGKLVLKIPWKNIYASPSIVSIEDIYLLVQPNQQVQYNEAKDEKRKLDFKRQEIQRIEEAKKLEAEKGQEPAKLGWTQEFTQKLVATIIKNIQLNIKNIHVRYEDKVTNKKSPFSLGVSLSDLIIESTDSNWQRTIAEDISKIYKILQLEGLSIYFNSKSTMYGDLSSADILSKMQNSIASTKKKPKGYTFILGPINSSARLRINQNPANDSPSFSIPKVHLNVQMEKLFIGISKLQYQDIIALADSLGRMSRGVPYRKFRPNVTSYTGHYKEWWQFAYTCIVEGEVKRRRKNWDWNHILGYRNKCKEYHHLLSKQVNNQLKSEDTHNLEECEKILDLTNIIIIRQKIEMETERSAQVQKKKTWFGWMWSGSDSESEEKSGATILKQIQNEMTPEEKNKLYKAMGYQENAAPATYPVEYVDMSLTFLLKTLEIQLRDDDLNNTSNVITVLSTDIKNVKCKMETRPAASAIKVHVKLDNFTALGMKQGDFLPKVITSETQEGLLEILFETNPLGGGCDQRVHVFAQPLKIVYDSQTINKVVDVFKIPSESSIDELQDAAINKLSDVKEMTSLGLQYAIEKHILLDLNIDLQAPLVIIPQGGKFTGKENVLLANLGRVKMYTFGKHSSATDVRKLYEQGKDQKDIYEFMKKYSYDKFKVELNDLQILMAESKEDWLTSLKDSATSDMHLLSPLSLSVTYSKCLIVDDPRLPLSTVTGELPSVGIVLSEARLILLVGLITSIELPGSEVPPPQPLTRGKGSSTMLLKYKEMQDTAKQTKRLLEASKLPPDSSKEHVQFTTLEAKFIMSEFSVTINQQESVSTEITELASFKVKSLECGLVQQTYVTNVSLLLGSIGLQLNRHGEVIDVIKTPSSGKEKECLFKVNFTQVDAKCPDLHSTYRSCEMSLLLNFAILKVILHQEGLLSLIRFSTAIQDQINLTTEAKNADRIVSTKSTRRLSTVSEYVLDVKNVKKKKKVPIVVASIKFKLVALLKELEVKFSTDKSDISSCAIRGIDTTIVVKDTYTQINAMLQEIAIIDLNPGTVHKLILSGTEGVALTTQIVINNLEENSTKSDIDIVVKMGEMRIVFLNWFISNMLNFLNQFQMAQQKIIEASQAAAETAKENMRDVYAKATKISLNINLKAPIILVPVNSCSYDSLLLDMGVITLTNKFLTLDVKNEEGHSVVVDDLKISLTDLKVSRILMNKKCDIDKESSLLEPLSFNIDVKRNLSTWYTSIPDINLFGKIGTIQISLSKADYQVIMNVLSGNLSEGQQEEPAQENPLPKSTANLSRTPVNVDIENRVDVASEIWKSKTQNQPHIFLKFTFSMERFIINMFTGGSKELTDNCFNHDSQNQLARFSLEGLSLKGRILTDQSIVTSILLMNCILDDMRIGREGKLKRLIDRSQRESDAASTDEDSLIGKSMIDITAQQKENDLFVDMRVFSFTIIVSVDYLLKVADFFNVSDTNNPPKSKTSATRQPVATKSLMQIDAKPPSEDNKQMTINLKLEKPDIILVEHMDNINTNAMILNGEILVKLRQAGQHQVLNGIIKELQLYTCIYNPKLRAESRGNILHPVTISLAGSTPEDKGLHLELLVTNVHLSVSPGTIELLSRVLSTMTSSESTGIEDSDQVFNHTDLWQQQALAEEDYWFLKTEYASDALQVMLNPDKKADNKVQLQELCIVSMPSLVITVEAGVGNKTLPILLLEMGFRGCARNWTSQLGVEASLTMQMGYYNSKLALWEPLIEPEVRNETQLPWELRLELSMNQSQEDNTLTSPISEGEVELLQPLINIDVISEKNLELTVTRTLLEDLQQLGKAFASAMNAKDIRHATTVNAPFKVINEIGEDVTLLLGESSFEIVEGGTTADINKSDAVPLQLKPEINAEEKIHFGKELSTNSLRKDHFLNVRINDKNCNLTLPVVRADKKFFPLNYRSSTNDSWGIVCDIRVDDGVTIITLRSILQVHNHFSVTIDVYYMTAKGNELEFIGPVQPNGLLNIPLKAVYNPTNELFFAISGYSVSCTPFVWKDLQTNITITNLLHCPQKDTKRGKEPFVIKAVGELEQVYYENTNRHTISSACYNIHLRPAVNFKNCLPFDVICCVDELVDEFPVPPGDTLQLPNIEPGMSALVIRLPKYLDREWSCREEVTAEPEEFSVWSFHSYDSPTKMTLDLGMHVLNKNGSLVLSLYCPFWMLNKTGLMIAYKSSDENINVLHHPAHFEGPILFSFNAKNFFGKKKTSIRMESGEWSDKFSLDVAGSSGVISCKWQDKIYQIGVHNQLTYNTSTKQVTFTPYYVIINNAPYPIDCQENDRPADPWVTVEPKSCSALWPKSEMADKLMKIRVGGTDDCTSPFLYTDSHTTLLKLNNKYGGINVDIQLTEGGVYINLAAYEVGSAPALLINHSTFPIEYWEKDSVQKRILQPKHTCLYTWENPAGDRIFAWSRGHNKEILNDLRKDMGGEFSPKDDVNICWASFLDGMQRILLFTEDRSLAEGAQASNLFEVIQQEVTISMHGIGLSLVNNDIRQEIMYVGIASSGIIWESSKMNSRRFKHMSPKESIQMENAYQEYLRRLETESEMDLSRTVVDGKMEVDFNLELMFKPHKRRIKRSFLNGLWLQMKTSPSQMQLHAKINRLQIDNQMFDCVFPVVLAPIPPPKSVAAKSGIKPFVEVSIVQLLLKNSQIRQFKYFKVLVQEFHVKVDMGFVNALLELMEQSENTDEEEKQLFLTDMQLVKEPLYAHASSQSIQEQKSFYDLLHFSPFKIHISFSMAAGSSSGSNASTPNFLNVLLQGLGVTLTDMQDVVFKLAFFERNYTFLTQAQLRSEATLHYVGQFVKQLYVLVLGLDVLGNPYGLVLGITKGVEDFFYEPIQGAIEGPGEFAEGLALGVRSLFGHTVGGAAGAMSRITGAMGKGIAALTFDDDFQRKRREQINKKPTTVQEGIARSGKGLVMGVYSGVTGVFTKPVEGAKEQGVEGFFKGLGKGAVGLVTRPVAGVVDFASGSLDVVKRAAECNEDTLRLRLPRFLQADGLVRPYNKVEAEGNKLLMELSKGKYAKTDVYEAHYHVIAGKEVLLLTDKRMAYVCHNDIFGGWQMEWSYTWEEIGSPPKVLPKGVLITTILKKKKLFGSSETGKTILLGDSRLKEDVCMKIEHLRNNYRISQL